MTEHRQNSPKTDSTHSVPPQEVQGIVELNFFLEI